ncbi:MAG TPA: DUF2059 domain-containing protein, partial [Chitinophagaceae bacterium]|nr:DUF2059 domain-containing protein [Chitinophagaceae bacterium]
RSQTDSSAKKAIAPIFTRIVSEIQTYVPDTSAAPDDKITRKIIEIRQLRGGFNINEAIEFKLEEDRQKGDLSPEQFNKLSAFFSSGNGKKWLDNAVIWIYRKHFTYSELKQMAKFYRTPAGKKMGSELPVIILQSLKASEMITGLKNP